MAKPASCFVITANLTEDGSVAYMKADQTWTAALGEAALIESKEVVQEMLRAAETQERIVCDPYAMKAERGDSGAVPLSARERIRNEGPTTRLRRADPTVA